MKPIFVTVLTAGMLLTGALGVCTEGLRSAQAQTVAASPARISYIEGDVSFWRPGAAEWTPARINTPLAPGDSLYTGPNGNVEVQIGPRAFLRAAEGTQVGLDNQEPGFVQFRVTAGRASVDLGELAQAQTVELDTPNAAFTIERTGYYRAEVTEDSTTFETQRGGSATMTPAGGAVGTIAAGRQVMVTGTNAARVDVGPAPGLTEWDRWNYERTDQLASSSSARYVASGVYGTPELDRYGSWRTVESYGSVWVPRTVATGWTPYSTGRWIWDPRYGWTWLDDEPWGWAPYHYGRWVHAGGFWGWAPGPIVTRPVYAPALVVFLGGGVRVSVGVPLAWAPLGWGEPIIPWWGRPGYVGHPSWDGWGGPRVVNNVVVKNTTIVNVQNITVYRNVTGPSGVNAVVGVAADHFGRADVRPSRFSEADVKQLTPVRGQLAVKPVAASLAPSGGTAVRPPEAIHGRSVVATRPPRDFTPALRAEGLATPSVATPSAGPRLVPAPKREAPQRPPAPAAVATPPPRRDASPARPPARPDAKGDRAAEQRPQPPTPAAAATPPPRREASPAEPPARLDAKPNKAVERAQPPRPPTVATPQPRREAVPTGSPAPADAKGNRANEQRPRAPTPPAVAIPQPRREGAPTGTSASPDAKPNKAAERVQSPPPPTVATPRPRREVTPAGPPARPDAKADRAAEQRPQPSLPAAVVTPPAKGPAPAAVPPPVGQAAPPRTERPNARPTVGQTAEPGVTIPEPSQPRGVRQ